MLLFILLLTKNTAVHLKHSSLAVLSTVFYFVSGIGTCLWRKFFNVWLSEKPAKKTSGERQSYLVINDFAVSRKSGLAKISWKREKTLALSTLNNKNDNTFQNNFSSWDIKKGSVLNLVLESFSTDDEYEFRSLCVHQVHLHLRDLAPGKVLLTCGCFCVRDLILHKPFWKHQAKPATFLLETATRSDHHIGNSVPYSFRRVRGFFYVLQSCEQLRVPRRSLRFIVLIRGPLKDRIHNEY